MRENVPCTPLNHVSLDRINESVELSNVVVELRQIVPRRLSNPLFGGIWSLRATIEHLPTSKEEIVLGHVKFLLRFQDLCVQVEREQELVFFEQASARISVHRIRVRVVDPDNTVFEAATLLCICD